MKKQKEMGRWLSPKESFSAESPLWIFFDNQCLEAINCCWSLVCFIVGEKDDFLPNLKYPGIDAHTVMKYLEFLT